MPLRVFKLFFTSLVILTIITNTNLYTSSKGATSRNLRRARFQRPLTLVELKIQLRMLVYILVILATYSTDYQLTNLELLTYLILAFISRTRFEQIKRYLYLSLLGPIPKEEQQKKIELVISLLKEAFLERLLKPRTQVSIDEIIVRFTGRSLYIIIIRNKLVSKGYKILALYNTSYVYSFILDSPIANFKSNKLVSKDIIRKEGMLRTLSLLKTLRTVLQLAL